MLKELKEERNMSHEEIKEYYQNLREYCLNRRLEVTTKGALTVAPKIKNISGILSQLVTNTLAGGKVTRKIEGLENIPKGAVIFASTH